MSRKTISCLKREEGQVWTYVLWIIAVALLIGIIISQFGPIISNHISIGSAASDAAEEGAIAYSQSRGDMEEVYEVVKRKLDEKGARLDGSIGFVEGKNGEPDMITVPVRRITNSYLFENVSYLCKYTEASAFGEHPVP